MKSKFLSYFKFVIICLCSCAVFVGSGYYYLNKNIEPTENDTSSVPYASAVPENAGVLLNISGEFTFFYFDFVNTSLYIMIPEDKFLKIPETIYGYPVDYTVEADYKLAADLIDFVDGIELTLESETLRYTGVQIMDILSRKNDTEMIKRTVLTEVMKKISKMGFDKKAFVYIIENSKTNLTVPDCYYWSDYMRELCKYGSIIN